MRRLRGWLLIGCVCAASGAAPAEPAELYRVSQGLPRASILEELHQPALSTTYRGERRMDTFRRAPARLSGERSAQTTYDAAYLVFYDKHDRAETVIQSSAKDVVKRADSWIQCGKRYGGDAAKRDARCTPIIEPLYRAQRAADAAEAMRLADHYRTIGDQARAESFYERALAATEDVYGADSQPVADVLKEYAASLRQAGEIADAASMENRVQEILSRGNAGKAPASD